MQGTFKNQLNDGWEKFQKLKKQLAIVKDMTNNPKKYTKSALKIKTIAETIQNIKKGQTIPVEQDYSIFNEPLRQDQVHQVLRFSIYKDAKLQHTIPEKKPKIAEGIQETQYLPNTFSNKSWHSLQKYQDSIGLIKALWIYNSQICFVNYGTAFAKCSNIIVTAGHNIFYQKYGAYATQIEFYPGVSFSCINKSTKIYRSEKKCFFKNQRPKKSMAQKPLRQELAMILLKDKLQCKQYLKIGISKNELIKSNLAVVGYPSKQFQNSVNLQNIQVRRQVLTGQCQRINGHIIQHNIPGAQIGHSGGPIIAINESAVVGINTHKGKSKFSQGLFFDQQIIKQVDEYEKTLKTSQQVIKYCNAKQRIVIGSKGQKISGEYINEII